MKLRIPSYVPEGLLLFAVIFGPLAFGAVEPWSKAILEVASLATFKIKRLPRFSRSCMGMTSLSGRCAAKIK